MASGLGVCSLVLHSSFTSRFNRVFVKSRLYPVGFPIDECWLFVLVILCEFSTIKIMYKLGGGVVSVMVLAYTAVYLSRHTRTAYEMPSTTPISLKESPMLSKLMRSSLVVKMSEKSSNRKNETNDVGEINFYSWETFSDVDSSTTSTTESSDLGNVSLSDIISSEKRRWKVKEMMKHAWDNYVTYAWGKNELRPVSKRGHTGSIFGSQPLGATILDSIDTLYLMGMNDEFKRARDWLATEFDVDSVVADVSVFEVNIRFIGGLLTCYALTGDVMFRDKAQHIADKLLPAFNTPTGIPNALVNFKTGTSKNYGWASGSSSILSEFGTLHLEFAYLSDITGNTIYRNKVDKIRQVLNEVEKPNGLYPNYLNPRSGKWGQHHMSMGALGDSFYEYLLKSWLQSGKEDNEARQMFDEAMDAAMKHLLKESPAGLTYFAEMKFERVEHKMDHLACFSGGMLALASKTLKDDHSSKYMDTAKQITNTCHESYDRTYTKLGPESFRFSEGAEARALKSTEKYYILRPETIESYFYLYRLTKDEKYRDWGWEAVQALEKHCRVPGGYTGIKNVYSEEPQQDDVQQSFFLAETLKYLYLLFSDDDYYSLDQWVFNTEAHPLPVKGINPFYREAAA